MTPGTKAKATSRIGILGLVGGLLLVAAPAFAQQPGAGGGTDVKTTGGGKGADGYGYEFTDDNLSAGGFGPNDSTIRVRQGAQRSLLIKPRTSFVPEMLKSVENL
jgi:hypothetical protein